MNVEDIYSLPMIKIDIFDHPFIKYDIFEATLNFPPEGNPVDIVTQYYDNQNVSYIYQSNNNRPWNKIFPARNRTNVWILIIVIKETTALQQATETISSHSSDIVHLPNLVNITINLTNDVHLLFH